MRIEQTIFVERDSQKAIVLGNGGRMIKQLSMEARKELAEILEKPVHLFLFVKVRENWGDDPERYRDLGLNFPRIDTSSTLSSRKSRSDYPGPRTAGSTSRSRTAAASSSASGMTGGAMTQHTPTAAWRVRTSHY